MDTQNISAEEMDARLMQATAKIREEALALDARNKELAILVAKKEAIADRLESLWAELQQIDSELSVLIPSVKTSVS
jgi:chromosome segregation ATPase